MAFINGQFLLKLGLPQIYGYVFPNNVFFIVDLGLKVTFACIQCTLIIIMIMALFTVDNILGVKNNFQYGPHQNTYTF